MSAVSVQDSENSPPLADAPGLAGPAWGGGPESARAAISLLVQLQRWAVYDHRTSLEDCWRINTVNLLRAWAITRISGPGTRPRHFR